MEGKPTNDTLSALLSPFQNEEKEVAIPKSEVVIQKILSVEEFQKKFMEKGCLKPAFIKEETVFVNKTWEFCQKNPEEKP